MKTLVLLTLPALLQASSPGLRSTIEATNQRLMEAFSKGNGKAIAALYSADAQLLPPDGKAVPSQGIAQYWDGAYQSGLTRLSIMTREVVDQGPFATEVGTWTIFSGDKPMDTGKFIVLWKQEQGVWKLHRDCWNSDHPRP